ncbi:MAG: hypothetical protein AB4372_21605 [Xenococcus sp. (in: cyanobacteria)]
MSINSTPPRSCTSVAPSQKGGLIFSAVKKHFSEKDLEGNPIYIYIYISETEILKLQLTKVEGKLESSKKMRTNGSHFAKE